MSWYDDTIDMITDTAIVSICNTDRSMIHWFADKHNNVLNLDFDDVLFTDEEAGESVRKSNSRCQGKDCN